MRRLSGNGDSDSQVLYATRGLGIFLVVFAHVVSGPQNRIIYLFHMPLFFLVAGITAQQFGGNVGGAATARRLRALIVPTLAALAIITLAGLLWARCWPTSFSGLVACGKGAYGAPGFSGAFTAYWFLAALCGLQVLLLVLGRHRFSRWPVALAFVIGGLLAFSPGMFAPMPKFALGGLYGAQFFLIGYVVPWTFYRRNAAALAVVALGALAVALAFPLSLDLAARNFGVPIISSAMALAMSAGLLVIFYCPGNLGSVLRRGSAWIGEASLVILLYHQAVQLAARKVAIGPQPWVALLLAVFLPGAAYYLCKGRGPLAVLVGSRPSRNDIHHVAVPPERA